MPELLLGHFVFAGSLGQSQNFFTTLGFVHPHT